MARISRFEKYLEALDYLRESAAAIDQAHALLHEIGLDGQAGIETGALSPLRYIGVGTLSNHVDAMVLSAGTVECPGCGAILSATCCGWGSGFARVERRVA